MLFFTKLPEQNVIVFVNICDKLFLILSESFKFHLVVL